MKHTATVLLMAAMAAVPATAPAGEKEGKVVQGLHATRSMERTAIVEAINHETREVTLKTGDGESVTFTAGDEVVNLAQVEAGDIVTAEYMETVDIKAWTGAHEGAKAGEAIVVGAAAEGDMPGMVAAESHVLSGIIEAIDLEHAMVTVKGPNGNSESFRAAMPEKLTEISVGDLVIATFVQAVGLSVETPAEAE